MFPAAHGTDHSNRRMDDTDVFSHRTERRTWLSGASDMQGID